MTVEQQKQAVKRFINWLTHPKELGKVPAELEIDSFFEEEGESYIILKFKPEKDDDWLFGVCGGFVPGKIEDSGIVWSEFEKLDSGDIVEKCKGYIKKLRESHKKNENSLIYQAQQLLNEKKWEEVIKFVDEHIDEVKQPREKDGQKCYQFFSDSDLIYFLSTNKEKFFRVEENELKLLQKKLYALIELKDDRAYRLINQMLELSPNNVSILFERFELEKFKRDLEGCWRELHTLFPLIWKAVDFARFLRANSWLYIEENDYEAAIHYLSWSLVFDGTDYAKNYVKNEIGYIQQKKGEEISRPTYDEDLKFFRENRLPYTPPNHIVSQMMGMYDFTIRYEKEFGEGEKNAAKQNLYIMTGWNLNAKIVEVNVLTPNRVIKDDKRVFNFQIPKAYKSEPLEGEKIFNIKNADDQLFLTIEECGRISSEEELKNLTNQQEALIKENEVIIEENINEKVKKIAVKTKEGKQILYFLTPLGRHFLGKVYGEIEDINGEKAKEMQTIVESIEESN